jgi:hypothetical protein
MKQYVFHTMPPLKPPNFKYKLICSCSLPLAIVQFDSRSSFASSSLLNVIFSLGLGLMLGHLVYQVVFPL